MKLAYNLKMAITNPEPQISRSAFQMSNLETCKANANSFMLLVTCNSILRFSYEQIVESKNFKSEYKIVCLEL